MSNVSKEHQDQLERIKKNIETSYNYFYDNCKMFHEFRKFAFVSSLTDSDRDLLATLGKPVLEFNIIEPYISRLLGEFSKQEPSLIITTDGTALPNEKVIEVIEGHFRHILAETDKERHSYEAYRDAISGGFSVLEVITDYANNKSFDQVIKFKRVQDPTLCGFDPTARDKCKNDGRYCFKTFPVTKNEAKKYDINTDNINFERTINFENSNSIGGFQWSYKNQNEDILIIADYYEKKIKRIKIHQLSDGTVKTAKEYDEMIKIWTESSMIEQPPAIVNSRYTEVQIICRYRLTENEILEYIETDFDSLPLIFVDGNSITYRETTSGAYKQFTKPLIFHAKGIQKLKNFAGQTLANELENMVQHKFKVIKEAIPQEHDYAEAYRNVQTANLLISNGFYKDNPEIPLPPPQEIVRTPIPPEVTNTFMLADQTTQNILGSYDAALGINNNQLSSLAIIEAATQSNAVAMPYIDGYLCALTMAAKVIIELIPKYYKTPRTIPVITQDGKRSYEKINDISVGAENYIDFNYDSNVFNVQVKAGVNFAVQKQKTMKYIVELSNSMPALNEFFNSNKAIPVLVENLDEIRGGDRLKKLAYEFVQQKEMAAQQAAQQPQKPDPIEVQLMLEQEALNIKKQQNKVEAALKASQIQVDSYGKETERMKLAVDSKQKRHDNLVKLDKHNAEKVSNIVDIAIKSANFTNKNNNKGKYNENEKLDI